MRSTLELKSSISLLKRLCADAALIEVRGKWSSWRIEEPVGSTPWKRVIEPPVIELRNAGFIVGSDEEDPTCKMGGTTGVTPIPSPTPGARGWRLLTRPRS